MRDPKLLVTTQKPTYPEISATALRQRASTPRKTDKCPQNYYRNINQNNGSLTRRMLQATPVNFEAHGVVLQD